ncbi:hypothetical protein COOONC_14589 [Cooperia oncophora]
MMSTSDDPTQMLHLPQDELSSSYDTSVADVPVIEKCIDAMKKLQRIIGEDFVDFAEHTRNDIIVGVEIRFEEMRFPAVTICNINPYKNSLARESPPIRSANLAIGAGQNEQSQQHDERKKRSVNVPSLSSAHVYCRRDNDHYTADPEGDERCVL